MTPIEKALDDIDYKPVPVNENNTGLPYVTYEGILQIGELSIKVLVLNTGQRIIPEDEMIKFFEGKTTTP